MSRGPYKIPRPETDAEIRARMRVYSGNWQVWRQLTFDAWRATFDRPSSEPRVCAEIRAVHALLQFLTRCCK